MTLMPPSRRRTHTDRTRRAAVRAAQIVVAVGLLVIVWRLAGPDAISMLISADPVWLMLAGVLLVAHTVFAALRWRVTAAPLGITLTRRQAITEYFLAQLVNTILPGGVLGDAGRAARSRHHAGLGTAAGAVVIERTIGQLSLLVTLGAAFVVTLVIPTGVVWPQGVAVVVASVLTGISVAALVLAIVVRHAQPRRGGRPARALNGIRSLVATDVLPAQVALSAATTVCILGAFACCVAAVGGSMSIVATPAVVPLVLLTMVLPISIGGWGVREGAAVALLPIAGVSSAEALAASVAFGIVALAAALPGFVAICTGRARADESVPGSEHAVPRHPFRTALPEESS